MQVAAGKPGKLGVFNSVPSAPRPPYREQNVLVQHCDRDCPQFVVEQGRRNEREYGQLRDDQHVSRTVSKGDGYFFS